jgi:phosphoglycerol transferase MdoB-like AlkP superfamily enzyme
MESRLIFLLKYFFYWLFYFAFLRFLFIVYNYDFVATIPFSEISKTFFYGLKLDISLTGYILLLTSLVTALTVRQGRILYYFSGVLTLLLLILFSLISVVDAELYHHWGFRIDSTVLLYLRTPKESLASTPVLKFILLIILTVLIILLFFRLYVKFVSKHLQTLPEIKWYNTLLYLLIAGLMIIPVRGGTGLAPINQGSVFFSKYQFANHASVNCSWNFGKSVMKMDKKKIVRFMPDDKAHQIFEDLFIKNQAKPLQQLVSAENPNIMIILLESFTAGVVGPLGGLKEVTPNLNKLTKEGVFFENFYATGDRSDKGLVAVLSGYPAQPASSIIRNIEKTEKLPFLSRDLAGRSYNSGFYYGGDIDFANMRSYFMTGGYDTLITLDDFDKKDLNSKWGAHDHVVFNRFFDDLNKASEPFFRVMFTLSSHEPYDVPHQSKFNGTSEEQLFLNSVHYTDSCLGAFIEKAKTTTWWKNTWLIILADHGKRLPGNIPYNSPEKFRIPMLWLGGVIQKNTVIKNTVSQTDVPLMISDQLQAHFKGYKFSKDVLNGQQPFAFFAYNDGFGFYNDTSGFVWDNVSGKVIYNEDASQKTMDQGKAFLQVLIEDYNNK